MIQDMKCNIMQSIFLLDLITNFYCIIKKRMHDFSFLGAYNF